MQMYDIYVFKGATQFFLYPKRVDNTRKSTIVKNSIECAFLYRRENETLFFHEKINSIRATEIDGMVIYWMSKEGIERVRGGSFSDAVLSNETKDHISKQIKYMNYDLPKNDAFMNEIDMSESQICAQRKIEKYSPKASIEELEWLRHKVETSLTSEWNFFDILDKYTCVMANLTEVYKQYLQYLEEFDRDFPPNKTNTTFLLCPRLYFDSQVIPEERVRGTFTENSDADIFATYELMIYTLMNRVEEFRFDERN